MRLDVLIVFNIQLCLLCLLCAPLLALIRKKLPHIPSPIHYLFVLLLGSMLHGFRTETYGNALIRLPFPLPRLPAVIPAFAAQDSGNDLLQKLWYIYGTGAVLTALILVGSHIIFRLKVRLEQSPAPQRVTDIAERVFRQKQYQLLMDICKRRNRPPTEKELKNLEKQKVPRIILSDAVRTPGILPSLRSCVLLDRADYTDEQLEAIFFYAFHHSAIDIACTHWYIIFFTSVCWFNPLFWFWHRTLHTDNSILSEGSLFSTDEETAERDNPEFYKAKRAAHAKLLDELVPDEIPNRNFFPIASTARGTERRKRALKRNTLDFISGFGFVLLLVFEIFMPFIIQPCVDYSVNEQTMFSVLGADSTLIDPDIRSYGHIDLSSTHEDGLLYGSDTAYASVNKEKEITSIIIEYYPSTDPAILEANVHRLFDALCTRLGAYTDTAAGALLRVPDLPKGLNDSTPIPVKQTVSFYWTTETTDSTPVTIRMSLTPDGANDNDGIYGGLSVEIEMR